MNEKKSIILIILIIKKKFYILFYLKIYILFYLKKVEVILKFLHLQKKNILQPSVLNFFASPKTTEIFEINLAGTPRIIGKIFISLLSFRSFLRTTFQHLQTGDDKLKIFNIIFYPRSSGDCLDRIMINNFPWSLYVAVNTS